MYVLVLFICFVACASARTWPDVPVSHNYPYSLFKSPPQNRIVNGVSAEIYQFPWFVSVRSHTAQGLQSVCGGSLIGPTWVLTAAHCTRNYISYTLGFGSIHLNAPLMTLQSTSVIEHSKYNADNLNYDIAVIRLPEEVTYSARIQAIRMPTLTQAGLGQWYTKARVCGYGRTGEGSTSLSTELKWVDKRVISNIQCSKSYGPSVVIPSTLCTLGWEYNAQSTCNGDSGGPLLIDEGGIWTQVGIVSFVSNQGCSSGHPAGYIRTTSFLNWISINTGISLRP